MKKTLLNLSIILILTFFPPIITVLLKAMLNVSAIQSVVITILSSLIITFWMCFVFYQKMKLARPSLLSNIWLFVFVLEFMFYSQMIAFPCIYGLPNPIYLENVSVFSQYRYILLLIFGFLSVVYLTITYLIPKVRNFTSKYGFPYVKEEIAILLHSFDLKFLGNVSIALTEKLHSSLLFQHVFFSLHFFLFDFLRIIRLSFFLNFCFFHGDLRYLLYLALFSFFTWLLSFFEYYHIWLIKANLNTLKDLVFTSYKDSNLMISQRTDNKGFTVIKDPDEIVFIWTSLALEKGFDDFDLPDIKNTWFKLNNILSMYQKHQIKRTYLAYVMLGCYIVCWIFLVHFFFGPLSANTIIPFVWPPIFRLGFRSSTHTSAILVARDARYLPESIQNKLRKESNGKYNPGHPVYGEERPSGEYVVEGSLTQGPGTKDHPSFPLQPKPIQGNARKLGEQRHIPFGQGNEATLPPGSTHPPIPGSSQALEQSDVKSKLDQN